MINYEQNLYHKIAYQFNVMLYTYYRYKLINMTHYNETKSIIIKACDTYVSDANSIACHLSEEEINELRNEVMWDFAELNMEDFRNLYSWRFQELLKIQKQWLAINCSL